MSHLIVTLEPPERAVRTVSGFLAACLLAAPAAWGEPPAPTPAASVPPAQHAIEAGPGPAPPCRVAFVRPGEDQVLYGMTELRAEAACQGGIGVAGVTFLVDGRVVAEAARPPYRALWDAGGSFGARLLEARLLDGRGAVTRAVLATPGSALRESVRVAATPLDRVELSVSVTDRDGRAIHGLTRDDFTVKEKGRARPVLTVQPERRPLSVAVLVDVSSSTLGMWGALRRAAPAFARTLGAEDEAKVIAFSGPAYLVQDFTRDVGAIEAAMARFQKWGGGTSLYDTLAAVGVELAWARGGRQAVVLLSDGIDTLSRIDLPRLRNYLRRTDVTIETFLVKPPGTSSQPGYERFERDIADLSRETGGEVRVFEDPAGLEEAFRRAGEDLQDRYLLTYESDRAGRPGAWRSIEVRTGRRGATVRTRGGVVGTRDIGACLLQDLEAGDAAARSKAAEWLGTLQAAGAGEALLGALADPSEDVRAAAANSLGRIREPRAVAPLVGLLSDPRESIRRAASEALQAFGPVAVPLLLDRLEGGGPDAQVKALEALAEIGDPRAAEAIARKALPPPPPTAPTPQDRRAARAAPADPRVRAWALWALGRLGRPDALPVLEKGVVDPDPQVRRAALRALGGIDAMRTIPVLLRVMSDGSREAEDRAAARAGLVASLQALAARGGLREWALGESGAESFLAIAQIAAEEAGAERDDLLHALGGPQAAEGLLRDFAATASTDRADRTRTILARLP